MAELRLVEGATPEGLASAMPKTIPNKVRNDLSELLLSGGNFSRDSLKTSGLIGSRQAKSLLEALASQGLLITEVEVPEVVETAEEGEEQIAEPEAPAEAPAPDPVIQSEAAEAMDDPEENPEAEEAAGVCVWKEDPCTKPTPPGMAFCPEHFVTFDSRRGGQAHNAIQRAYDYITRMVEHNGWMKPRLSEGEAAQKFNESQAAFSEGPGHFGEAIRLADWSRTIVTRVYCEGRISFFGEVLALAGPGDDVSDPSRLLDQAERLLEKKPWEAKRTLDGMRAKNIPGVGQLIPQGLYEAYKHRRSGERISSLSLGDLLGPEQKREARRMGRQRDRRDDRRGRRDEE